MPNEDQRSAGPMRPEIGPGLGRGERDGLDGHLWPTSLTEREAHATRGVRFDGLSPAGGWELSSRPIFGGWERPTNGTHASEDIQPMVEPTRGPDFGVTVPRGGYAWWRIDASSDNGEQGLSIVAFVGGAFSPWYARARRRGNAYPARHCVMNVALYGPWGKRWSMTERSLSAGDRGRDWLKMGPSALTWEDDGLAVRIDEIASPLGRRIRGTVRLTPDALESTTRWLDHVGRHRWRPIAPCARVRVTMETPDLTWSGSAYLDTIVGDRALEADFRRWDWSRALVPGGTIVQFEVVSKNPASNLRLATRYDRSGGMRDFVGPPTGALARGPFWRMNRRIGSEPNRAPKVIRTLEDTPFFTRSIVETSLEGGPVAAMHESLSLDRFRKSWVQVLLPIRMRRAR